MTPPAESSLVLSPEARGGWCYHDTALGTTSWFAPEGSTPLVTKVVHRQVLPNTAPPQLPCWLGLGTLRSTDWMLLRGDADGRLLLMSRTTGAVREAPWVSLLSTTGVVYFANLTTHETRWLPPHRWMEGWCLRARFTAAALSHVDAARSVGKPWTPSVVHNQGRRIDDRDVLPQGVARRLVEGGAPYMLDGGEPQYEPDEDDSPATYPLQDYVWRAPRVFLVHPGSPLHRRQIDPCNPRWRHSMRDRHGGSIVLESWVGDIEHEAGCWVRTSEVEEGDEVPEHIGYVGPRVGTARCSNNGSNDSCDETASTASISAGEKEGDADPEAQDVVEGAARVRQRAWRQGVCGDAAAVIQRSWRHYSQVVEEVLTKRRLSQGPRCNDVSGTIRVGAAESDDDDYDWVPPWARGAVDFYGERSGGWQGPEGELSERALTSQSRGIPTPPPWMGKWRPSRENLETNWDRAADGAALWRAAAVIQRAWRIWTFGWLSEGRQCWERWSNTIRQTDRLLTAGYNLVARRFLLWTPREMREPGWDSLPTSWRVSALREPGSSGPPRHDCWHDRFRDPWWRPMARRQPLRTDAGPGYLEDFPRTPMEARDHGMSVREIGGVRERDMDDP